MLGLVGRSWCWPLCVVWMEDKTRSLAGRMFVGSCDVFVKQCQDFVEKGGGHDLKPGCGLAQ